MNRETAPASKNKVVQAYSEVLLTCKPYKSQQHLGPPRYRVGLIFCAVMLWDLLLVRVSLEF